MCPLLQLLLNRWVSKGEITSPQNPARPLHLALTSSYAARAMPRPLLRQQREFMSSFNSLTDLQSL